MHRIQSSLNRRFGNLGNFYTFLFGIGLMVTGIIMAAIPDKIFALIVSVSIVIFALLALYYTYRAITRRHWTELLIALGAQFLTLTLSRYDFLPEYIIRISFGFYCLISCMANLIQLVLDIINRNRRYLRMFFFAVVYGGFGLAMLFLPEVHTDLLMIFFGLYFIALGLRFLTDALDVMFPRVRYHWSRQMRIMLPPLLCAFLPERALSTINQALQSGQGFNLQTAKNENEQTDLKIMVFTGPVGLQKVGHCCFSYKDVVFSYGNYDAPPSGPGKVLGDGCFFTAPLNDYLESMLWAEHNSIFQYDIRLNPAQAVKIESQLKELLETSYRWYCQLEREDGYDHVQDYEHDYANRLHYLTGAKFYKIHKGKFRYYFFLGDNCASFMDEILGGLGADILNLRGFITPGAYYEFLENEYIKANSPVIAKNVYPYLSPVKQ